MAKVLECDDLDGDWATISMVMLVLFGPNYINDKKKDNPYSSF